MASLTVDGAPAPLTNNTYTFSDVTGSHTISANFNKQVETITASAGTGGTISPSGPVSVNYGENQTISVSAGTGYNVAQVTVDGVNQELLHKNSFSYTFKDVTLNHTMSAIFSLQPEAITISAGNNGGISPSGTVDVNYGASQTLILTPNPGYTAKLTVDGSAVSLTNNKYTLSNITTTHRVSASFSLQSETITASAGSNGTISPSGLVSVNYGANRTFTVKPNKGYTAQLMVDGKTAVLIKNAYTFSNVTENHTVVASFS
jgi:hypothetical protein